MIVNVQLQVSGDNISSYDIYQNTDNFVSALATGVTVAELQSNYELTANDQASIIRFVPDSACGNYKDVFINFNDATPSITLVTNYTMPFVTNSAKCVSTATNNAGAIFTMYYGDSYISIDNGASWQQNESFGSDDSPAKIVCVSQNKFRVIKKSGQSFIWLNAGGWMPTESGASHNVTGSILDLYFHNGIYYIRTESSIYRSEYGNTFISVLDYTGSDININNSIAGYGNTLYATNNEELYKSTDNGLNWVVVNTATAYGKRFSSIYVESETDLVVSTIDTSDNSTLSWSYSNDGGTTLAVSWLPNRPQAAPLSTISNTMIKIGDVYYFVGSSDLLSYTSDNIFTSTTGLVNEIPNTNLDDSSAGLLSDGRYNSVSLIGSEDRIIFSRQINESGDYPTATYVGLITNT